MDGVTLSFAETSVGLSRSSWTIYPLLSLGRSLLPLPMYASSAPAAFAYSLTAKTISKVICSQ